LKTYAGQQAKPWDDLGVQETYLVQDLKTYGLWNQVTTATNPGPVVASLVTTYEKPLDPTSAIATRTPLARAVLQKDAPGAYDRIKAALSNPGQTLTDAASSAGSTIVSAVEPVVLKATFAVLGLALLGYGLVSAAKSGQAKYG
jgi:hypothetical protein